MKTTIDLPDRLLDRTKIEAVRRRTTIKNLMIQGLEMVLDGQPKDSDPSGALARLRQGYHLGGKPMGREDSHAR